MKREEITYQTNTGEFVAEKLLPCPFCGGEPEFVTIGNDYTKSRKAEIKCTKCFCKRTTGAIHNNLEWCGRKAIELWNKRTAEHPLPPAEGAEEILEGVMVENGFTYVSFPAFVENESSIDVFDIACKAMTEFATLHAQRIADKMVEERLREYHLNEGYDIVMVGNPDKEIDGDIFEDIKVAALELSELRGLKVMITGFYANYLKSRDSHEQHR